MNIGGRLAALLLGAASVVAIDAGTALAQSDLERRIARLEQQNAELLRELAELRRERKSASAAPAVRPVVARREVGNPAIAVSGAEAAAEDVGGIKFWVEGGATFSAGDRVSVPYRWVDYSSVGALVGAGAANNRAFDLTPSMGYEAAAGFTHRFAGSPWSVIGGFRYGMASATGRDSSQGEIDPATLALLNLGVAEAGGRQAIEASYSETRWQADAAVGYDVLATRFGRLQLTGGLRVAGLTGQTHLSDQRQINARFEPPQIIVGFPVAEFGIGNTDVLDRRTSFLGAGPRIGVDGSAPLGNSRWTFDYLADAAILFGTQKITDNAATTTTASPEIIGLLVGGQSTTTRTHDQRSATMFNVNLQVGTSFRITPNVKLSASYRMDAYFNALNTTFAPAAPDTISRITHGPRLSVTAQF